MAATDIIGMVCRFGCISAELFSNQFDVASAGNRDAPLYPRRCCSRFELNLGNPCDNPGAQLRDNPRRLGTFYQRGRVGGASIGGRRSRGRQPVRRRRNRTAGDVHPRCRTADRPQFRDCPHRGRPWRDCRRAADAVHGGAVRDGRCGARISQSSRTHRAASGARGRAPRPGILLPGFFVPGHRRNDRDGPARSATSSRPHC